MLLCLFSSRQLKVDVNDKDFEAIFFVNIIYSKELGELQQRVIGFRFLTSTIKVAVKHIPLIYTKLTSKMYYEVFDLELGLKSSLKKSSLGFT